MAKYVKIFLFGLVWNVVVGFFYFFALMMLLSGVPAALFIIIILTLFLGAGAWMFIVPFIIVILNRFREKQISLGNYAESNNPPPNIPPLIFWGGLCQFIVGVALVAVFLFPSIFRWNAMRSFEETTCVLNSVKAKKKRRGNDSYWSLDADFYYEYNGRSFMGTQFSPGDKFFPNESGARRFAEKITQTRERACYVNPEKPDQAFLFRDIRDLDFGSGGFGAVILFVGLVAMGIGSRSWVKSNTPRKARIVKNERVIFWGLMLFSWSLFFAALLIGDACDAELNGPEASSRNGILIFFGLGAAIFIWRLIHHAMSEGADLPAISEESREEFRRKVFQRRIDEKRKIRKKRRLKRPSKIHEEIDEEISSMAGEDRLFSYEALDSQGRLFKESIRAEDKDAVIRMLREFGCEPVSISEEITPEQTFHYEGENASGKKEYGSLRARNMKDAWNILKTRGYKNLSLSSSPEALGLTRKDTIGDKISKPIVVLMFFILFGAAGIFTFTMQHYVKFHNLAPERRASIQGVVVDVKTDSGLVKYSFELNGKKRKGATYVKDRAEEYREGDPLVIFYSKEHPWIHRADTGRKLITPEEPPRIALVTGLIIIAATLTIFLCSSYRYLGRVLKARSKGEDAPKGDLKRVAFNAISAALFPLIFINAFAMLSAQDKDGLLRPYGPHLVALMIILAVLAIIIKKKSPPFYD